MSASIEEDTEAQDLNNIINSLNKEIEEGSICLTDTLECDGEGGEGISVEYVGKEYCLDESGNLRLTLSSDKSKESSSCVEKRTDSIIQKQSTKSKTVTTNSGKGVVTSVATAVYVHKPQIKTESEQLVDDPAPIRQNEEIYEFDEIEELSAPAPEVGSQGPTLLKLLPLKNEDIPRSGTSHACPHCDYKAPKRYMLSRHMKTHSDERPYVCAVCDRGFKTNHTLQNHINVHLGNKPHACLSCSSRFTTPGDLARHVRYKHTHEKRHKCTECDYATVELSKLRRHMRAHTGERPYQCPHCTYASPDTFKLKRHLRTHTGEKPYECDICQSRFTQSNSLKSHKLIHSVDDKPVFQCALCPTTCSRKSDLRIHVQKLHYSETPFPCKRCGKELPDRYSYKMHVKTHEGERCYSCDQCHYKSISMRNLEIHKQIHSNEKPFACEICGQTFRQKQLLGRHINLYHTANYVPPTKLEKIHHCPYCSRSFAHKGNMVRHMQSHDSAQDENVQQIRLDIDKVKSNVSDLENTYGEETMNEEHYEEYEVIDEMEPDEIDDYVIVETIDPSTSRVDDNSNNNMVQSPNATFFEDIDQSNYEIQQMKCFVKLEESNCEVETKERFVERIVEEDSCMAGFMVVKVLESDDELDDDDNCVILTNFDKIKSESADNNEYKSRVDVENCFGFKTEDDKTSDGIEETVLLNIVEEN